MVYTLYAENMLGIGSWREYIGGMSLEKMSQIITNAFKTATAVSGGTPDEKHALEALGGLAGLIEARARQSAHLNPPANPSSVSAQKLKSFASIPTPTAAPAGSKPAPAGSSDDPYDLK